MIKGWWFLIRHPRQWKRTESVGGQDFFIVGNNDDNNNGHEPITKRISYSRQLGSEKSRQHSPDDGDNDNDSIEEIQPMPHSNNQEHHRQMYEMNHISPVSPISPILANSNFGSQTALNETTNHSHVGQALTSHAPGTALTSHAPGILPDTRKTTAYPGQNRWSDSTSGTPSFSGHVEAGNVSRRHETTNLFFDAPDEQEEPGRTRTNKKLDNML